MKKNIVSFLRLSLLIALFALAQMPVPVAQAQAGTPQLILTKTVDDNVTIAQVGDVIRYRIRWECSSLTTACGIMEITDVLQAGLTYLPPPNSSVPSGFQITYNGVTRTVTITKTDNNLLDGTQFDAVIAVRVDNDLRPLPTTVNNTVNGRIDPPGPVGWTNATPASAPPITIGTVSPSWALTKTRVAPVIEPTLNTDVTYQLRLCPVPPPTGGIAALTDIVLTDTLPANAVFVSASDGGTFGGGVVTWPTVAGPLYPPDCITRLVTMRYPSPLFIITDTLTNSANVTAGYIDSLGNPCPNCFAPPATLITHNIIPIADVPTYSKGDAGDPVGITGTARFILNLNTNLTNYPANAVTLIDNLPGQLQVTSVTSGTWSADFDNVRAYVEYSTNYGSTWVAFSGQPVSYNTNAAYTAPVDNITNVRWRFEYDQDRDGTYAPGLPYVWQFSSNPEIRVTPRATDTVADPPSGVSMPAAMIGSTYTNCVQVSRVGQGGPVTDPCSNQDMTVRGDYTSLQVSKNETPGTPWDEWDDPTINTFASDATILPGDTLRYVLTVDMTERSSAPLSNPTILDTMPADLVFVRQGSIRVNGTLLSAAYPAAIVNFTNNQPNGNPGAGQTLLWEINNLTLPEQSLGSQVLTVEFFARIPRGQLFGARTNALFVVTDSLDVLCEIGTQLTDVSDVDGDGNTAEFTCRNTDNYVVDRSAALRGEKWIRSVAAVNNQVVDSTTFLPDASCPNGGMSGLPGSSNPFTRFPCISQAYPEGALNPGQYTSPPSGAADLDDFEYQLSIFNDGNVPMLNYVLYDILPFYGDRGSGGTLFSSPRSSEFRPVMTGPIQFLGGAGLVAGNFTIEYNLTTNPCRPEVFNQTSGTIPAGCSDTWIPSAATAGWTASDWATVRSYRIRLNSGFTIAPYIEGDPTNIVRFGLLLSIPADSPVVGVFNNDDAQSREIAWNSFAHVGSYQDLSSAIRDLLASEPRKVGITIPERFSIGNRVWRDSDNSGTINPPDDTNPGIAGVLVQLYLSSNTTTPIATTTTDTGGYYLFSNLPEGDYVVGIPASNFDIVGDPLFNLRSSTGTPASATYTNPPETNPDREDHGRDPATLGQEVFSAVITLSRTTEQSGETDLSSNNRDGPAGTRRGLNGERDYNSDLTVDFGFFGGTDVPFSIGNHLWYDDGTGGGVLNDGIRQAGELPVVGATLYIYRDGNANGIPDAGERILNRSDVTDAGGFYLFDNLDPGTYFIQVVPANFDTVGDPLDGWFSSQPTGTEMLGVNGSTSTADLDNDDNGVNTDFPDTRGVFSGPVVLMRNGLPSDQEPLGETHLSGQIDPGPPTNDDFDPTGWDGPTPGSRGRFGETDATSNLTIDFGFIPPMSLGNRVWFDNGSTTGGLVLSQYNDGIMNGNEAGVNGVRVELYRDTNGDGILQPGEFIRATTTDATGYYLFEYLQPAVNYYIHIPNDNFGNTGAGDLVSTDPLLSHLSSNGGAVPADDATDINDNGIDNANPLANGITSQVIAMAYGSEPTTPPESDISPNVAVYGTGNVGRQGQTDASSNLTMDFGFFPVYSLGNRAWLDTGGTTGIANNGVMDGDEAGINSLTVRLYRDANDDGIPDGASISTASTDTNGYYRFDNLIAGTYIVEVVPPAGLGSTVDTNQDPDNNTDLDDNGVIVLVSGEVRSKPVTLGDLPEPTGEEPTPPNPDSANGEAPDTQSNRTVDFGFVGAVAIGNVVWLDTGVGANYNNGIFDTDETGVNGVIVELYNATTNTKVVTGPDGIPNSGDESLGDVVTSSGGYYRFDQLIPGNYYVRIPASEFQAGKPLYTYISSSDSVPATTSQTADNNADENGIDGTPASPLTVNGIRTLTYTLTPGTMPVADDDTFYTGTLPDNSVNFTADFGFVEAYSLGNRVWLDTNGDGLRNDGVEPGIRDVTVNLYRDTNNDGTPDGPIVHTVLTDADGYYRFDHLIADTYIVEVTIPTGGYASTLNAGDPDLDADDDDDNGVLLVVVGTENRVRSDPATLEPRINSEPQTEGNPVTNPEAGEAPDARSNRTVDFGFLASNAISRKQLTGTIIMDTDPATGNPVAGTDFTSGTQVAIGEIITYQIQLEVPSGETFTNLSAVDELNPGLAFIGCDSVIASHPGLTTTLPAFTDACNPPTNPTVAPQSTPESENDANLVTFSLGNVTNGTATAQTITITYRVSVLDIPLNRNGGTNVLNNKSTWLWLGTNLPPVSATPVQVVEPNLSVDKKARPTSAPYGRNIRFTFDIAHTAVSTIDAFDVVVTDVLPPGLQYVAGSASFAGLAPNIPTPPADYYDAATSTLTFIWDVFPLGDTATITFLATFVGPAPVVNSANVAWTSLPIDPQPNGQPVRLSPYNDFSTERWYDPADLTGLNVYIASDSVTINLPRGTLPATGFAPNVETQILPQPLTMKYAATDILLEIPSLGIKLPVVGVPNKNGTWDVTWLGKQAGWLEGSAFPSWNGNSVLTSHVYQSNGLPGPFVNLNKLKYGDTIIVHAYGQKHNFEVRANSVVEPNDTTVFKHEEKAWLTLITCKEYDEKTNTYKKRVVVRAVLVSVEGE